MWMRIASAATICVLCACGAVDDQEASGDLLKESVTSSEKEVIQAYCGTAYYQQSTIDACAYYTAAQRQAWCDLNNQCNSTCSSTHGAECGDGFGPFEAGCYSTFSVNCRCSCYEW